MLADETKKTEVWDTKTQAFHGGQEHRFLDNFVEDFSVTTNYLGTPRKALDAAREAISEVHHYPAANQEPAKTSLAQFLWPSNYSEHHGRLLLGNGASELIDLVVRKTLLTCVSRGVTKPKWKGGPWNVQYREYQRSAENNEFEIMDPTYKEPVDLLCVVNPCNPTGDYFDVESLKAFIKANVVSGGTVLVDESMQPWHSSDFRSDSLTSAHAFVKEMWEHDQIGVHVIHSWTKIWSCTGLRVGSVITPTASHCEALRKIQVPWSVNGPALKFVEAVVLDDDYMKETWENTTRLRAYLIDQLTGLNDKWVYHGKPFLSWVWVDMLSEEVASKAIDLARQAGVPVRSGKPGYSCPTFVRVAVRKEPEIARLINAWKSL
ncbi:pyridoxal phosphate-dependent transferase [Zychaea mexicana]|uniref:pyridoxal phosphate-dependent transferase n=1 Tax=Zychaea mexicana TaxID=64656 RepID=UPI0022FDC5CA|nr:pyridoxal phosphate-dependent transferase [Zychaea mexicana]KAI9489684.1 pyridoxal phosphate-dependent transferase [Zychaea mexicana]